MQYATSKENAQGTVFSTDWCGACRNYEDAYADPGSPASRRTSLGTSVLAMVDGQKKLLMQGGIDCHLLCCLRACLTALQDLLRLKH